MFLQVLTLKRQQGTCSCVPTDVSKKKTFIILQNREEMEPITVERQIVDIGMSTSENLTKWTFCETAECSKIHFPWFLLAQFILLCVREVD